MLLAASISFVAFDSEVVGSGRGGVGVECEEKTRTCGRECNGSEVNCEGWSHCEIFCEENVGKDQQIKKMAVYFRHTQTNDQS